MATQTQKLVKYVVQLEDGKWYRVAHRQPPYAHVCCDCHLTHIVKYKFENGTLWERWVRDDKATAKARRKAE